MLIYISSIKRIIKNKVTYNTFFFEFIKLDICERHKKCNIINGNNIWIVSFYLFYNQYKWIIPFVYNLK
ncbi:hypothetical protein PFBG_02301 [Plasmodium falciparum 7G8]|uniref:Uncharacterized protein n=2 Tax=Plasmodium falciparum TaxID=5833 RepID=W7FE40_PLAF8|nr:hypothetical protein PFNF135_02386 [Plasmodium falciparum NF135/5.C10]EUR72726.1 hypothetical protein PFBG_02301 [Plasmodium falciparum 7G8]